MSSFTTPLELEYIDGRSWRITREFDYYLGPGLSTYTFTIPAGFITDFASVPRALWAVFPPTGPYGKAAVVHDYLYVLGGRLGSDLIVSRSETDRIFREAMATLGVGTVRRWLMWVAVRLFGRGAF